MLYDNQIIAPGTLVYVANQDEFESLSDRFSRPAPALAMGIGLVLACMKHTKFTNTHLCLTACQDRIRWLLLDKYLDRP